MVDVYVFSEFEDFPLGLVYDTDNFISISNMLMEINDGYKDLLKELDFLVTGAELKILESKIKQWILKNIKNRINPPKPKKAFKGYLEKYIFEQFIRLDTRNNPNDEKLKYMYSFFLIIEKSVRNNSKIYFYNVSGLSDESEVFSIIKKTNRGMNVEEILTELQKNKTTSENLETVKVHLEKLIGKSLIERKKEGNVFLLNEKGKRVYL